MTWIVVDPKYATADGVKVARVEVPYFSDEVEYESIVERAFGGEQFRAWREETGLLLLATPEAYEKLEKLMASDYVDVPAATVRDECVKLALERQVVVLKFTKDSPV